jgi:hypothetical protein
MKKSLLLSSALLVGVGAFAQTNRMALGKQLVTKRMPSAVEANPSQTSQIKPVAHNSTLITSTGFTSARNGFGMLVEETVPLSYNADLNMVAFTMRLPLATGTYAYATTGITSPNSGHMITHYTTDNGTTWNRASLFTATSTTVGGALARYPSGVIANAPGNTDASQASFVGTGPCTGGAGWLANWFASRPANETGNTMANDMQVKFTAADSVNSLCRNTYFSSYCTTTNGTDVWTGGYAYEVTGTDIMGVAIYKGVKGANGYTWSRPIDALIMGALDSNNFSNPKIAFSPNGQVGYILINGTSRTNTGNAIKSYQPQLWKTTDGGNNWAKVNDNYDWKASHPEIACNLIESRYDDQWGGSREKYPAFFDSHGGEITVDNNGKLHYFTTVVAGYSSHPDSLGYTYGQTGFGYAQYDNLDKPWVWHFTTEGNGSWDAKFISYLYTRNLSTSEVVGTDAFWTTDGSASLDYNNRIKVSRSNDGSKIFVTWTDSDTTSADANNAGFYVPNKNPSIYYKGLDVATGNFTPTKEASYFDAAEGGFYLHQTSEIVMPSANGFTIPTIYISSSDGSQNATNGVDFNYISDLEILNSEYTVTLPGNVSPTTDCITTLPIGIANASATVNSVSQNYPNPFATTSVINVTLTKSEVITVNVTNLAGQVVLSKAVKGNAGVNEITVDAASLESGIYFYNVTAGDSKVTRKMSVVK